MAAGQTVNADNLIRLGAERLAEILLGVAEENADVKRVLRLELAAEAGGEVIAGEIGKRLTALGSARSFIDWRKQREFARDLDLQREMIVNRVAATRPDLALELMWRFTELAGPVFNRVDDSNGMVGDIFRSACEDLGAVAVKAKPASAVLADRVLAGLSANDWGIYDRLVESIVPALDELGVARLKAKLTEALSEKEGGGRRPNWNSGDLLRALQAIADHECDVDAYAALIPAVERTHPRNAAALGRRLLAAGRSAEALAALEAARPMDRSGRADDEGDIHLASLISDGEWEDVYLDALDAGGRREDAQQLRWRIFEDRLSEARLRAYLQRLDDFEDVDAEHKAMQHALGHKSFATALHFLHSWPEPERAAELVLARHTEIDGNSYYLLDPAARQLEAKDPLAATLLRRAMIEHTLTGARHTRYKHAARHILECESIARAIPDHGKFETHNTFVERLRAKHGRKTGFWAQLAELSGPKR